MENTCPERECHDKVQKAYNMAKEHHEALFETGGVKNQLEAIRTELINKANKGDVVKKPHWGVWAGIIFTMIFSIFSSFMSLRDSTKASPLIYSTKDDNAALRLEIREVDTNQKVTDQQVDSIDKSVTEIKGILNTTQQDFKEALQEQKKDVGQKIDEVKTLIKTMHR